MSVVRFFFLFVSVGILSISCDQETKGNGVIEDDFSGQDTITLQLKGKLKPRLTLTQKAAEEIDNWTLYKTVQHNLKIGRDTLSIGKMKSLLAVMTSGFDSLDEAENANVSVTPIPLSTPAIQARMLTVETQVKVLNNLSQKQKLQIDAIEKEWIKLHDAFQNLNLQINERFAKSIEDILEELDDNNDETTPSSPIKQLQSN